MPTHQQIEKVDKRVKKKASRNRGFVKQTIKICLDLGLDRIASRPINIELFIYFHWP